MSNDETQPVQPSSGSRWEPAEQPPAPTPRGVRPAPRRLGSPGRTAAGCCSPVARWASRWSPAPAASPSVMRPPTTTDGAAPDVRPAGAGRVPGQLPRRRAAGHVPGTGPARPTASPTRAATTGTATGSSPTTAPTRLLDVMKRRDGVVRACRRGRPVAGPAARHVLVGRPAAASRTSAAGPTGLDSVGRLTGLVASVLLLAQVVLMARVPLLERAFGQDRLARIHRLVGFTSFNLMLAHVVLITWGYALGSRGPRSRRRSGTCSSTTPACCSPSAGPSRWSWSWSPA